MLIAGSHVRRAESQTMRALPPVLLSLLAACATHAAIPAAPARESEGRGETTVIDVIDESAEQRMEWGPPPLGTTHAPRERSYDVRHQVVRVAFDRGRHAVVGSTDLQVSGLRQPFRRVDLDAVDLQIRRVADGLGEALDYTYDGRTLSVALPAAVPPGDMARITIDYEAIRPKAGVYFADGKSVIWTQGKAQDNRYWIPMVDHPGDKTTWEFHIRTAPNERAFAVGRLIGRREVEGGIEWHWVQEQPAPTHMMTVVVGPYDVVEDSSGSVPLRYWTFGGSVEAARAGFAATPHVVRLFADKLGVPLPALSLELVAVPDYIFWDALESWRPVVTTTVLDERMILDDLRGWPGEERDLAVARLVAQEWFGKLLTPRDWTHAWLAESFAHFMAQIFLEATKGVAAAADLRQWAHVGAFAADRDARRPLVFDRWLYGPIELWLTEHLQHRGASVLQMLRHELGDSLFWRGMAHYVRARAGGTVETEDFRIAMEEATGHDLRRFFEQWVYGAGFPFLRVSFAYDSASRRLTLTVRQVQQRDSATGFFEAPVDVEVLTEEGTVRTVFPLRAEEVSEYAIEVPAAPLAVQWDPGRWLISDVEFPRPTSMLVHQLRHASDARARIDALEALHSRATGTEGGGARMIILDSPEAGLPSADPTALTAIIEAARSDRAPEVRVMAMMTLGFMLDPVARQALLDLSRASEPEVRAAAAGSLFGALIPDVRDRLRQLATQDPDPQVREVAAQRLSIADAEFAWRHSTEVLASDTASEATRGQALALADPSRSAEAWELARRHLVDPDASRVVRQSAMRSLGIAVFMAHFAPHAKAEELVKLLTPFLDSDDPSTRLSAARELSHAKIPEALAALVRRKQIEVDARVLMQIDDSMRQIERRGEPGW